MTKKLIIILFIAWINFNSSLALSFTKETRRAMIIDTILFCPPELKSYLIKNISIINSGMSFVDRNPNVDFKPAQIKIFYSQLIERLKLGDENSYNTIRKFGLLSCYIVENINPCDVGKTLSKKVPQATEDEKVVKYDGYQKIDNDNIEKRIEKLINYKKIYYFGIK